MTETCDSCGEDRELKEYKDSKGEPFFWCDDCKEEEEKVASLPTCLNCEEPMDSSAELCQGCEDKAIFYGGVR
jgi:hypothetical protein